MKQVWLVVNAFWHSKSTLNLETALFNAAKDCGLSLQIKRNDQFIKVDSLLDVPKASLFFDKDIRLAQRMESRGIRLYNSAKTIAVCDDKTWTSLILANCSLPQPQTVLCPATFPGRGYGEMRFLDEVAEQLGFPMVVKEGKGSFGQQVYLAEDIQQLRAILEQTGAEPVLFQRFIKESAGQDIRVYVVGEHTVAAIRRVNYNGDFRANIEHGGQAIPYSLTPEEARLAVDACKSVGADFAGVDLLQSKDGPLICEINSNAHFTGLMQATGVNPAIHMMHLIKETL